MRALSLFLILLTLCDFRSAASVCRLTVRECCNFGYPQKNELRAVWVPSRIAYLGTHQVKTSVILIYAHRPISTSQMMAKRKSTKEARRATKLTDVGVAETRRSKPKPKKLTIQPPSSKSVRLATLQKTTTVSAPSTRKRKAPMSPRTQMAFARTAFKDSKKLEASFIADIALLKLPRGRVRTYEENCVIINAVQTLRLQALYKKNKISRTELALEIGNLLHVTPMGGQPGCVFELDRQWEEDTSRRRWSWGTSARRVRARARRPSRSIVALRFRRICILYFHKLYSLH